METQFVQGQHFGGPEVLTLETERLEAPARDQLLVRHAAIGVNFIDINQRRGEGSRATPYRLGLEAAGEVLAVGPDVTDFAPGDRIVYAGGPMGAYAQARRLPAGRAVRLPDDVEYRAAAGVLFKGLTADYLVHRLRRLVPGDAVLFTAAAGGVGQIAVPMLKQLGVVVIGTVGDESKVQAAREAGCDHVLVLTANAEQSLSQIKEWTQGKGVTVAYDSIGRATFELSLASLGRFGLLVSYGRASGEVEPLQLSRLREMGSLFVTRPTVGDYTAERDDLLVSAERVFAALRAGIVKANIFDELDLSQAGEAHRMIEARRTQGSVLLRA